MRDRGWSLLAWIVYAILVPYGFLVLGRFAFVDYPWREATDIGVSLKNGGLQFNVVPFIPIADTIRLFLATAAYIVVVCFLTFEVRKRFGPLWGKGSPKKGG